MKLTTSKELTMKLNLSNMHCFLTPSTKHNETCLVCVAGFYLFSLVYSVMDMIIIQRIFIKKLNHYKYFLTECRNNCFCFLQIQICSEHLLFKWSAQSQTELVFMCCKTATWKDFLFSYFNVEMSMSFYNTFSVFYS